MANVTLPPKSRPEWAQMVNGKIAHKFQNYILQTKTFQLQKDLTSGKITINQAVDEFYDLCSKYVLAVQIDFKQIFKTW